MRTYPNMNDLLAAIEEKLDVNTTAETVQKDIAVMKKMPPDGFDAPIKFNRTLNLAMSIPILIFLFTGCP